jgi:hypothetical protein
MGTDLADNYVMVQISIYIDTLLTSNKPINNCPKFGRRFTGHYVQGQKKNPNKYISNYNSQCILHFF